MHDSPLTLIDRGPAIARSFGIRAIPANPALCDIPRLALRISACLEPGRLVLITGASGSGKSSLLTHLEHLFAPRTISVSTIHIPDAITVDCIPELDTQDALELLSRFGLGEVYTYLSPARKLSTGQQFRLRLAMAWARTLGCPLPKVLLCDEFATQLDHITAAVLGRLTRRQVSADGRICFVAASCHEEIARALKPDLIIHCDFGQFHVAEQTT